MSQHTQLKNELKQISKEAKNQFKNDNPAIRQIINDSADSLCKAHNLSEHKRDLLSNYACSLHPKN